VNEGPKLANINTTDWHDKDKINVNNNNNNKNNNNNNNNNNNGNNCWDSISVLEEGALICLRSKN